MNSERHSYCRDALVFILLMSISAVAMFAAYFLGYVVLTFFLGCVSVGIAFYSEYFMGIHYPDFLI